MLSIRRFTGIASLVAVAVIAAIVVAAPSFQDAQAGKKKDKDKRALGLRKGKKKVYGQKAMHWTRDWWQWVYSLPAAINPGIDDSGDHGGYAQRGPVWFLLGAFDTDVVANRDVEVPSGKALFFPVVHAQVDNVGVDPPSDVKRLRERAAEAVAGATGLRVELDGVALPDNAITRIATREFGYVFTEDNVGQYLGRSTPPGVYAPAVADGYWVMLRPLTPGAHTLRIQGQNGESQTDVSYSLTVVDQESYPGKTAR